MKSEICRNARQETSFIKQCFSAFSGEVYSVNFAPIAIVSLMVLNLPVLTGDFGQDLLRQSRAGFCHRR